MSNPIRDFRNAVRERLASEVEAIQLDDIVVERKHSLTENLNATVSRATNGLVVTVGPASGTNTEPESGLTFLVDYEVTLWVLPIYRHGEFPEDDIFIPMMQAVSGEADLCGYRTQVLSFRDVPDPQYLAMSFRLRRMMHLD